MNRIERAAWVISQAADGLLQQHKYSNGYLSLGDSEIAEANLVIHVASSFICAGSHVWAESPFKTHEGNQCKHLDLLVDLAPEDPETATLLTIEAKRIGLGEGDKKVEEILKDYERIRSWRSLAPEQIPLFYGLAHPVEWFYGCLLVVFSEQCDKFGNAVRDLFSSWWRDRTTRPSGFSESGIFRLEDVLNASVLCDSRLAKTWDGGRRMAVAYALFDFGPGSGSYETAAHEAAHTIVAWCLSVPVRAIALTADGELRGGVICDWESLRDSQSNRETCIRGFAVAYAGAIHQAVNDDEGRSFPEILDTLPTDGKRPLRPLHFSVARSHLLQSVVLNAVAMELLKADQTGRSIRATSVFCRKCRMKRSSRLPSSRPILGNTSPNRMRPSGTRRPTLRSPLM
jgi:hypothetical protein